MHSQASKSNQVTKTSSQYFCNKNQLKENVKDEVDFLPSDKCQMFPQIDIIILGVRGKACPNYPK